LGWSEVGMVPFWHGGAKKRWPRRVSEEGKSPFLYHLGGSVIRCDRLIRKRSFDFFLLMQPAILARRGHRARSDRRDAQKLVKIHNIKV